MFLQAVLPLVERLGFVCLGKTHSIWRNHCHSLTGHYLWNHDWAPTAEPVCLVTQSLPAELSGTRRALTLGSLRLILGSFLWTCNCLQPFLLLCSLHRKWCLTGWGLLLCLYFLYQKVPVTSEKSLRDLREWGGGGSKSQHAPAPLEAQVHFLELQLFKR